ncbi:MAG: hypothetical protein IPJ90_15620 [Anaerolineaceae bacterium]|nr:hypothetical protein [Anaerolineaceae bacterium]
MNVVDLKPDEGYQTHDHLFSVTEQVEKNGFWIITMDSDCAYALQSNGTVEFIQNRIENSCGPNGERINIEKLAESRDAESLQSLREVEEKETRSVRVTFYFSQVLWGAFTLLIGALLPLLVILRYLKTRHKSFVKYVYLVLVAQIGIFIFLGFVYWYLYWASFSLAIIVPLLLVEIGLLIGAKLENRYQTTREVGWFRPTTLAPNQVLQRCAGQFV